MKIRTSLAALLLAAAGTLSTCCADELYQISWRGTAYHTTESGKVVMRRVTEAEYINRAAANNGLDARTLALAYRANKRDIAVIRRSDGAFIADAIQLEYKFTEAAKPDGSQIYRQSFIFDEFHDEAIGSAFGTERSKRDKNGNLVHFSYRGSFNYSLPENGEVISGTFSTSRKIVDRTPND
jgi:hypothetical protein